MKVVQNKDELELRDDTVIIRKRGLSNAMASGMNGDREINVRDISAIQLKLGGTFSPGFIQFSYPGSKPFRGGLIEATQDPDAFIFNKTANQEMVSFKEAVDRATRQARSEPPKGSLGSVADELAKLADLRSQGVLTDKEFDQAKARLLGS